MKIFAIAGLVLLSSCNPMKAQWTKSNIYIKRIVSRPAPEPSPVPAINNNTGFKITTGIGTMAGSDLSAKAAILPNDRKLVGGNLSGTFSISKDQVR